MITDLLVRGCTLYTVQTILLNVKKYYSNALEYRCLYNFEIREFLKFFCFLSLIFFFTVYTHTDGLYTYLQLHICTLVGTSCCMISKIFRGRRGGGEDTP